MGHDVGDRILIMTAERLSKMLNPGDTLCRFSGDVFAMILPERESRHEAITMSYQILAGLTEPFRLDNQQVNLTGSIGNHLRISLCIHLADFLCQELFFVPR